MSSPLTRVVRPNETLDIRPLRPFISASARGPTEGNPTLQWGSSGDSIFTVQQQLVNEFETKEAEEKEVSRTVDVIRVKNEDDPEQHVDVESVTELTVLGTDGKRRKVKYQPDELGENREMIEKGRTKLAAI